MSLIVGVFKSIYSFLADISRIADLKATFQLQILGVKKNPQSPMYTQLGVLTKGTVIEVNVSELGMVTTGGKVVFGKYAQVTNNPENDGCINAVLRKCLSHSLETFLVNDHRSSCIIDPLLHSTTLCFLRTINLSLAAQISVSIQLYVPSVVTNMRNLAYWRTRAFENDLKSIYVVTLN